MSNKSNAIHHDFFVAQKFAYEPSGLIIKNIMPETENKKYGACEFKINNLHIKFRVAKITPTKTGQFVAFYKRIKNGPIVPYDISDPFDLLVVSVRDGERLGQFIFSKSTLYKKGILSKEELGGKRAIRVYPPWSTTVNKQAQSTQLWQNKYFIEIQPNTKINKTLIQKLYQYKNQ